MRIDHSTSIPRTDYRVFKIFPHPSPVSLLPLWPRGSLPPQLPGHPVGAPEPGDARSAPDALHALAVAPLGLAGATLAALLTLVVGEKTTYF